MVAYTNSVRQKAMHSFSGHFNRLNTAMLGYTLGAVCLGRRPLRLTGSNLFINIRTFGGTATAHVDGLLLSWVWWRRYIYWRIVARTPPLKTQTQTNLYNWPRIFSSNILYVYTVYSNARVPSISRCMSSSSLSQSIKLRSESELG